MIWFSHLARAGHMSRVAVALSCKANVGAEFERLSRSRSDEVRMVERAHLVLACLNGQRNDEIAGAMGLQPNAVGQWRLRFAARGLAALQDARRSEKAAKCGAGLREDVLAQPKLAPPEGMASREGGALVVALGVPDDAVGHVLRNQGIQLQRYCSWCVTTYSDFVAKATDVGLRSNLPQNPLVPSVGESSSIQALERTRNYEQTSSRKIVQGMRRTYKRRGIFNLFAALEVPTSVIRDKVTQIEKCLKSESFLEEVIADQPAARQFRTIRDNINTRKTTAPSSSRTRT